MCAVKLVRVDGEVEVFAASAIDARFLYREIFGECCYGEIELPERALVLDVGANIGIFTMYVKERRPDARVLAFEPALESANALRRNVAMRGLLDVSVHELALGQQERDGVPFTYYPLVPCNSTMHPAEQRSLQALVGRAFPPRLVERMFTGREISVSVARLSRFLCEGQPVELLKVDAVGAELEILRGVDAGHWSLIRRVIIDVQDLNGRVGTLCEYLDAHGLAPTVTQSGLAHHDRLNYIIHAAQR
jgi:FkbM family methyltransferase